MDMYGGEVKTGGETFDVAFQGPYLDHSPAVDNGDGTYSVHYRYELPYCLHGHGLYHTPTFSLGLDGQAHTLYMFLMTALILHPGILIIF